MSERPNLGALLTDLGRIDQEDVARALEYQVEHGGLFGEALISLGIVTSEELEWGLASQFDLPYVFPDVETIDPEAAWLVAPEWSLANLILPIAQTDEAVKVIVASPNKPGPLEDLARRIDRRIDLAIASPGKIRELIRKVYVPGTGDPAEGLSSVTLAQGFGLALGAASSRFGISARGHGAVFWWHEDGRVRRRPLDGLWRQELDARVQPAPSDRVADVPRAHFEGRLVRDGRATPVDVNYLGDEHGAEYLFRPVERRHEPSDRFDPPPPEICSEARLLARSGAARFLVTASPDELGMDIIPHLPALLRMDGRSVFIHGGVRDVESGVFGVQLSSDPGSWRSELGGLGVFSFDMVTIDLPSEEEGWLSAALDVAPVTFVLGDALQRLNELKRAGVEWTISVAEGGEGLDWSLEPLQT